MSDDNPYGAVLAASLRPATVETTAPYAMASPFEAVALLWENWDVVGSTACLAQNDAPLSAAFGIFLLRHRRGLWVGTAVDLGPAPEGQQLVEGLECRRPHLRSPEDWGWSLWDATIRRHRVADAVKGSLASVGDGLYGFVEETALHLREAGTYHEERYPKLQATIRMIAALDDAVDPDVAGVKTLLGLGGFDGALDRALAPAPA